MGKVKIGLIGCGIHAMRDIYPVLPKIEVIELVAVCDRNIDKVKRCAVLFGIKNYYINHEEMVSNEELDAVIIIGPPLMHFELGMFCLESGLHIFIEKPSAATVDHALELSENSITVSTEDPENITTGKETLDCDYDGDPMIIGYNAFYLREVLQHQSSDEIKIMLKSPLNAGLFVPMDQGNNNNKTTLLMPIRLND